MPIGRTNNHEDGLQALHVACLNGHIDVVTLLIDSGVNINDTTNNGHTPLYLACRNGHYEIVKFLLDLNSQTLNKYVDTTIKDKQGWSVLHAACFKGHTLVVKLLIDIGMNINESAFGDNTPLHVACSMGHYDTVKFLLDLNGPTLNSCVDPTITDEDGWSVLHTACSKGHKEVVKLLVDVGLNVNDTTNVGDTPLYIACQDGHLDTVKYLLDLKDQTLTSRVDKTMKDKDRWSVLHAACSKGHKDIVKLLVDVGLNVNDITHDGYTPLFLACEDGHLDTVKFLLDLKDQTLKRCVDTTIKDQNEWSVLHVACLMGHTEVVKLLMDVGINVNDTANNDNTPLSAACKNGHYDIVKFLLDLKDQSFKSCVDTTIKDENGWSVLHVACLMGHTEVVKLLIDVGINVNDTANNGNTPLSAACLNGHYDTVKYLLDLKDQTLKSRVDTTMKDEDGWSVLHSACSTGQKGVVKLLVDGGLNVNYTTHKGYTPLHLACHRGHYDTVKYLLDLNGQTLNSCVDTTMKDEDGWSVLHSACSNGHTKIVKLLFDDGLNLNDTTNDGYTPLYLARRSIHNDTVKFLLHLNVEQINSHVETAIDNTNRQLAVHAAYSNELTKVQKILNDAGINYRETRKTKHSCVIL